MGKAWTARGGGLRKLGRKEGRLGKEALADNEEPEHPFKSAFTLGDPKGHSSKLIWVPCGFGMNCRLNCSRGEGASSIKDSLGIGGSTLHH